MDETFYISKGMCKKCYNKYVGNAKWRPILDVKRFFFKGKTIHAPNTPRIGVCNFCRAVVGEINTQTNKLCKRTNLAHMAYHDDNPLKDTLELCVVCHSRHDRTTIDMQTHKQKKLNLTA